MMKSVLILFASFIVRPCYSFVSVQTMTTRGLLPVTNALSSQVIAHQEEEMYMPPGKLPPKENLSAGSTHRLGRLELVKAINDVKRFVEARLESDLNVVKVCLGVGAINEKVGFTIHSFLKLYCFQHPAPLAFLKGTGVNDELDGTESKSAVRFTVPNKDIPRGLKVVIEASNHERGNGV
jgi:hypothetical protein